MVKACMEDGRAGCDGDDDVVVAMVDEFMDVFLIVSFVCRDEVVIFAVIFYDSNNEETPVALL